MDTTQLVKFMDVSVAGRIDSPRFCVFMDRLRTEWGMDTPQLVKLIHVSVAARIDSPLGRQEHVARFQLC